MRRLATTASLTTLAVIAFGAVTLVALEGQTVAVLQTTKPTGDLRRTHVWVARDDDGSLWIESATASRPFYLDLAAQPALLIEIRRYGLDRNPVVLRGRAAFVPDPVGHARIRTLLSAAYGWADSWVALLTDTSQSRAVRITVETPP